MSLTVRVSGQADLSQIKREVKDLDRSFTSLRRASERGMQRGFFDRQQLSGLRMYREQLRDTIGTLDTLLDEQYQKIEKLNQALNESRSPEMIKNLEKELKLRRELVDTTQEQIRAIEDRSRRLEQETSDISVTGGGSSGGSTGGSALSTALAMGKKALGIAGLVGGTALVKTALNNAITRQTTVSALGMRIGGANPNFDALRQGIRDTGLGYGYNAIESMQMLDSYTSRGGRLGTGDQAAIQAFSRAWGMDSDRTGATFGEFRRYGASSVGGQRQLADALTSAIDKSGMQERAVEAMEATAGLMGDLGKKLPEVSVGGLLALQTLLNRSGNQGLMGERGADVLGSLNSMFSGGGQATEFFTLRALGWGTDKGWYEAERQREKGISDPNNLAAVLSSIRTFGNEQMENLALRQMTGLSINQIEALRKGTNNFQDLSTANLTQLQNQIMSNSGTEARAETWASSMGGQIEIASSKLEEALATVGNGLVEDFVKLQDISGNIVNMFGGLLGSDTTSGGGLIGGSITPTTAILGGLAGASALGLGKNIMNLFRGGASTVGKELTEEGMEQVAKTGILQSIGGAGGKLVAKGASSLMNATRGWGDDLLTKNPVIGGLVKSGLQKVDDILPSLSKASTTGSKILGKIPLVGAIVETLINKSQGDSWGRAITRGIASNIGSTLGLAGAAAAGVGTGGAGFALSGAAAIGGGLAGDKAGSWLYDTLFGGGTKQSTTTAAGSTGYIPSWLGANVTSHYGRRTVNGKANLHTGLDFGVSANTPIESLGGGKVVYSGYDKGGGNIIKVKLPSGETLTYAHLNTRNFETGDTVSSGQILGLSGNTGTNTTGSHLHFGVQDKSGATIDPEKWLAVRYGNVAAMAGNQQAVSSSSRMDLNVNVTLQGEGLSTMQESKFKTIVTEVIQEAERQRLFSNPYAFGTNRN